VDAQPDAPDPQIRFATVDDVALVLSFIRKLAHYEKLSDQVVATEDLLRETLFGPRRTAEVLLAYCRKQPVGFALFFHNYSTFLGRPGIYLEDLYVDEGVRGKGIGKALLVYLAQLAKQRHCGRLEWWVLDWNDSAIRFYEGLGAMPMNDWTVFRMAGDALDRLAGVDTPPPAPTSI
jgi:GNAT superfamily N-acetyltransferase